MEENGTLVIDIHGEIWNGEDEVTNGMFIGKFKHAELHAVNANYHRMQTKENLAYGLLPSPYQTMKLPKESNWVKAIEKYPIGKVIQLKKVKFEIFKVEVNLPVEAFGKGKNITEMEDFYIDVYFRLEGTKIDPSIIQISL
ncbi:hypothetical protein V7200_05670 [Cytobacillus firmus]|uniref:Uncharacterized protein n=2 Tax=Cytobacillus firmus TaxID=1399 RepID=A0A800NFQ6_CYTFI|nr:hypothetical protein [Cytobacillus firmus]KAF0825761.1 hypothetical protein KIS1582_0434 [Cytobacillus firmus]